MRRPGRTSILKRSAPANRATRGTTVARRPRLTPDVLRELQRTAGNQAVSARMRAAADEEAARSPGRPLDPHARDRLEAPLGRALGHVRIHTDEHAARAAHAVRARAFTVADDIYFGSGRFDVDTRAGRALAGHELAHVVHQDPQRGSRGTPAALEREAADAGRAVADGAAATVRGGAPVGVQRQAEPAKRIPKKGVKTAAAPDAFRGIDYYLAVENSLPPEDTWIFYASNENFTVGRAMRVGPDGEMTTLYYSAVVKSPAARGPQWIIGPDAIDVFMANPEHFSFLTIPAPLDPHRLSRWERSVHFAQMSVLRGDIGEALRHVGRSHVEKWSDEPLGTVLDLLPIGRKGARPKGPRPKFHGPPAPKPPVAKPPVAKPAVAKPAVRESAGAAPPGTKEMTDPFSGSKGQVVATSKTPRSQRTATQASSAEFQAYDTALHKKNEIGIQRPGSVNQGGPDFITARRDAQNRIEIVVNDATINVRKKPKVKLPKTWDREVRDAISKQRLKLGDPALEEEIRQAYKAGRVRIRTQRVEKTPAGDLIITDM